MQNDPVTAPQLEAPDHPHEQSATVRPCRAPGCAITTRRAHAVCTAHVDVLEGYGCCHRCQPEYHPAREWAARLAEPYAFVCQHPRLVRDLPLIPGGALECLDCRELVTVAALMGLE